jgi:hypothetical protein
MNAKDLKLIAFLLLILLSLGCKEGVFDVAVLNGRIKEIQNEDKATIGEYSYKSNGELKESWSVEDYYSEDERKEYTYTYNSKGQIIQKEGYEPGIIYMSSYHGGMGKDVDYNYQYDSEGRIEKIKIDYDYGSEIDINYSTITTYKYPGNSIIVETITNIHPSLDEIVYYKEYHYNSDGNIEKIIVYNKVSETENRVSEEVLFTYDNNKAPQPFDPVLVSANNVLKESSTVFNYDENGNQSIAYASVFNYEYSYNSEGYPDRQIKTNSNGMKITRYFKYE